MALDGIYLRHICKEIENSVLNARVDKIYQPRKEDLLFEIRTKKGHKRLLLSASSNGGRVCFIDEKPEAPQTPPMLCMLFRKRLIGAKIKKITQVGLDRIIVIEFEAVSSIGELENISIVVELLGVQNNIIMIDKDNKIIDSVKRIGIDSNQSRIILPKMRYEFPAMQNKLNILSEDAEVISEKITENLKHCKNLSQATLQTIQGISPIIAREIDFLVNERNHKLTQVLTDLKETVRNTSATAYIIFQKDKKPIDISFMKIEQYGNSACCEKSESFSKNVEDFFQLKNSNNILNATARELCHKIKKIKSRIENKTVKQAEELDKSRKREQLKKTADILSANISFLKKGISEVELYDFYANCQVMIKLDPLITPSQNIQKYYRLYKKAVTAETMLSAEIEKAKTEIEYLDTVLYELNNAKTNSELEQITDELYEQKYLHKSKTRQKKTKRIKPHGLTLKSGNTVFVGRNNKENDFLTLKLANKNDIWFHIKDMPGSHVILTTDKTEPTEDEIYYVACIALEHSKAKNAGKTAVDYTYVKNVKKPNGAKPGMVIYVNYKTIYADSRGCNEKFNKK